MRADGIGLRCLGAAGSDGLKTTVEVVTPNDIDLGLTSQWHELQTGIGDTPFMSPEFAAAVDRVRGDVFVILVTRGDRLLAAWPLQRRHRFMAEPVGFGLSDFQGPVVAPGFRFDPAAVLRRTRRFATYDFDHLIDPAGNFARWSSQARPSPFIDVDSELAHSGRCCSSVSQSCWSELHSSGAEPNARWVRLLSRPTLDRTPIFQNGF